MIFNWDLKLDGGIKEPENTQGRLLVNQSAAGEGVSIHRVGVLAG